MESLAQLLRQYQRHPSPAAARRMLPALAGAQLFWPVTPGAAEDAAQGGLRPDTIPGPEGQVLYPAFSAQEQIPADYGARFTFLHLPFSELCRAALGDPRFAGLVLDPFTAKLFLPPEVLGPFATPAQ